MAKNLLAVVIIGIASAATLIVAFMAFSTLYNDHIIAVAKETPEGKLFLANCPNTFIQYKSGSGLNPIAEVNFHYVAPITVSIRPDSLELNIAVNQINDKIVSLNLTHIVPIGDIGDEISSHSVVDSRVLPVLEDASSCEEIASSMRMSYYNLTMGSKSYPVAYSFQNKDARLLSMTVDTNPDAISTEVYVPNNTTLELLMPSAITKTVLHFPCSPCPEGRFAISSAVNNVRVPTDISLVNNEEVLRFQLSAGSSTIKLSSIALFG